MREQGFRAHHCHKIERRAREVVKATRKNKGRKPATEKADSEARLLGLQVRPKQ